MSLNIAAEQQDKNGVVPSERLIQTALKLGFSSDELDELRQIYCFAMDGKDDPCASDLGRINMEKTKKEVA